MRHLPEHFPLRSEEYPIERAKTQEKSHGRIEIRELEVAEALPGYPVWPGIRRIFRIHRTRIERNKTSQESICGITSLSKDKADAAQLLFLIRRHWEIENSLHHVRDVTFNEDRCRVRNRKKAQGMAAFRNLAITLLRHQGYENIAEGIEILAENKQNALRLVRFGRIE
jgi:predicted transposase YbfD/YdcC